MRTGISVDRRVKTIAGRSIQASAGSNIYKFRKEDEWVLAILANAMKAEFYGELNLKIENGVVVIAEEVKKHKPKRVR